VARRGGTEEPRGRGSALKQDGRLKSPCGEKVGGALRLTRVAPRKSAGVLATLAAAVLSGCGSGGSGSTTTTASRGSVPSTQNVYLATALACRYVGTDQGEGVAFKPLKVKGPRVQHHHRSDQ
jgi:hypothetical protein